MEWDQISTTSHFLQRYKERIGPLSGLSDDWLGASVISTSRFVALQHKLDIGWTLGNGADIVFNEETGTLFFCLKKDGKYIAKTCGSTKEADVYDMTVLEAGRLVTYEVNKHSGKKRQKRAIRVNDQPVKAMETT